jgi:hypothetical protein
MIVDRNFNEVGRGFSRRDKVEYAKKMASINTIMFVKDKEAVSRASAAFRATVQKQLEMAGVR